MEGDGITGMTVGGREKETRVNRDGGGCRVAKQDERSGGENASGRKTGIMEEGGEWRPGGRERKETSAAGK